MHLAAVEHSGILISCAFAFLQDMAVLHRPVLREFNPCRAIQHIDAGTSKSHTAADIHPFPNIKQKIVPESLYIFEIDYGWIDRRIDRREFDDIMFDAAEYRIDSICHPFIRIVFVHDRITFRQDVAVLTHAIPFEFD